MAVRSLDRAAAEEISQEVFLAVWRHAGSFDPTRGTFRAWVLQTNRSRVLNELRRCSRRPRATMQSSGSDGDVRGRSAALSGSVNLAEVRVGSDLGHLTDFTTMTIIRRLRAIRTARPTKKLWHLGTLGDLTLRKPAKPQNTAWRLAGCAELG
jgi:DNA-directed RNA polymerase specialized sigma24 family protein